MARNNLINTLVHALVIILCIYVAYLIFYSVEFTPEKSHINRGVEFTPEKSHINRGTCVIPELTNFDQFYSYFDKPKAACNNKVQVGGVKRPDGIIDGDKWVCFDNGFKPNDCVVYSFGIMNEWSFDDAMDRRYCQVFSFDPTMGAKDHMRSQRITFFNLGINNFTGYSKMFSGNCKMDRYRSIVEMLGHSSTIIDYFKMDIEGSEVSVFKDILHNDIELLNNVQQIGMEIHPGKPDSDVVTQIFKDHWYIFHRLECLGWRLFNSEINRVPINHFILNGVLRSHCYEVVWIKT